MSCLDNCNSKDKIYCNINNKLERANYSNKFIRAIELLPDEYEVEIINGNKMIIDNFKNIDFYLDITNIKKGFCGVYPFYEIILNLYQKEKAVLFYLYIEDLSLNEIARKLNCSLVKAKIISKFAHKHFFEELKKLSRELLIKNLGENCNE